MSVYLRARSKLDLVSNQGCSFLPCVQDRKKEKKAKKKIPPHYSFVIQCVKVFSRCGFRHISVCVGVWWHGKTKQKKNKTCYYFTHLFLCVFNVQVLSQESSRNVSFYPLIWIHVRYINMIFKYSDRQIFRSGVKTTQLLCYTQVRGAFLFYLSALFVSSTGVIVVHQQSPSLLIRSWIWLGRPRCGPVHSPERDFWPLSQKPDIVPLYPVCLSSGQPADSWSPGSALTSDGTAPEQQLARALPQMWKEPRISIRYVL